MSTSLRTFMLGTALLVASLLVGCTLPGGLAVEGTELTPIVTEVAPLSGTEGEGGATLSPSFETIAPAGEQPTLTPTLSEGPEVAFGPATVESENFRTLETVTVRLQRGSAVSNITCRYTIQETGADVVLSTPESQQLDPATFQDVFTFSPTQAGTYQINCTGLATTTDGVRPVSYAGTPFSIEAKG
jgi:hypothetical protein